MDLNGICYQRAAVDVRIVKGSNIFQQINELNLCLRSASIKDKNGTFLSAVAYIVTDTMHLY
jgi:hypothetical protein